MPSIIHIQADLLLFFRERRHGVADVDVETKLLEGGTLDSLMLLDLILHIQRTYDVALGAADVTKSNFCNVAALAQLIAQRSEQVNRRAA